MKVFSSIKKLSMKCEHSNLSSKNGFGLTCVNCGNKCKKCSVCNKMFTVRTIKDGKCGRCLKYNGTRNNRIIGFDSELQAWIVENEGVVSYKSFEEMKNDNAFRNHVIALATESTRSPYTHMYIS